MNRPWAFALLCVATMTFSACQSADVAGGQADAEMVARAPFRVAIAPVRSREMPTEMSANAAGDGATPLELKMAVDEDSVTQMLSEELRSNVFADIVVLEYPADTVKDDFKKKLGFEQDQVWFQLARDQKADVVLISEMVVSPTVTTTRNSSFWWNVPVFLLVGPISYLIDDREYAVDAQLSGRIYEISSVRSMSEVVDPRRNRLVTVSSRFEKADLDFIDRASLTDDFDSFASTLVLPPGLFAVETEQTLGTLKGEVVRDLCEKLGLEIQDRRDELVNAEDVLTFSIDMKRTSASYANSRIGVSSVAILRRVSGVEALYGYRISVDGDRGVVGLFTNSVSSKDDLRYPFETAVPAMPGVRVVRLTIIDDSPDRNERSFTIPVVGGGSVSGKDGMP